MSSILGCSNLHLEKILVDTPSSFVTDTPIDLSGRLQSISFEPNNQEAKVDADDGVVDTFYGTPDGKVSISLTYLTPAEKALFFGNTQVGPISCGGDSSDIPYFQIKYKENWDDRTIYKALYKVKMIPGSMSVETKKSDGLSPQSITLEGSAVVRNYKPANDSTKNNLFAEADTAHASYNGEGSTWFSTPDVLSTPDLVAPTLSSSTPTSDAEGVAANASYVIVFDKGILPTTVNSANFFLVKDSDGSIVAGALSQSTDYKTITFDPTSNLTTSAVYRFVITTGVKSLSSVPLAAALVRKFTVTS